MTITADVDVPSTATIFGRPVLPGVPEGAVPYWRLVLRGCSQCCFQTNEVTGLIFLVAVLTYSREQALLMLMAALIAPAVALVLRGDRFLLELGVFGFNSCLMALALGNFFEHDAALWIWAATLSGLAAAVTVVAVRFIRFPILAAPFIVLFWIFFEFAEDVGLTARQFPPFTDVDYDSFRAGMSALGAALFAGTVTAGVLFFVAVLVSNYRHAMLAVSAAFLADRIAEWWDVPGEQINLGLAGFNAVLAAVAIYAFAGADIRLSLLGAVFASA
ncbi:MAG: urea transporter, partial [Ilumatobacteraceae bacterium]|nr:urea transporter [Ilumatobacteraceae bacterium]